MLLNVLIDYWHFFWSRSVRWGGGAVAKGRVLESQNQNEQPGTKNGPTGRESNSLTVLTAWTRAGARLSEKRGDRKRTESRSSQERQFLEVEELEQQQHPEESPADPAHILLLLFKLQTGPRLLERSASAEKSGEHGEAEAGKDTGTQVLASLCKSFIQASRALWSKTLHVTIHFFEICRRKTKQILLFHKTDSAVSQNRTLQPELSLPCTLHAAHIYSCVNVST